MKETYLKLKSGTDVRGVAVGDEEHPATLTEEHGSATGVAFAGWLAWKLQKPVDALTIAVGRDPRVTGEALLAAIARGLAVRGAKVADCGLCTTPAMFMTTKLMGCDGAVMVTASHLPWQRNGYKFFTPDGGLDGGDISALLGAAADSLPVWDGAAAEKVDFLSIYTAHLAKMITGALGSDSPLAGLHIVVDAGNGAGGFYADMLAGLGADTSGSQFLAPDGRFPNHPPNPEDPAAMASLSAAVLAAGADLGVIFDADCDRAAMVGADGGDINRNRLIALVSAVLLQQQPGITVVTDSVVSTGLMRFLAARGGHLHRFKRGYRNVIDEAIRLNGEGVDCPLAMETSGHAALRENYFLDDGMYLVTRLIIEAKKLQREGKALASLVDDLQEPVESVEVRLTIDADDFRSAGDACLRAVLGEVEASTELSLDEGNREGARILFGSEDEWALIRQSLHDPVLVINVESAREGGVQAILAKLRRLLAPRKDIDLAALDARLHA